MFKNLLKYIPDFSYLNIFLDDRNYNLQVKRESIEGYKTNNTQSNIQSNPKKEVNNKSQCFPKLIRNNSVKDVNVNFYDIDFKEEFSKNNSQLEFNNNNSVSEFSKDYQPEVIFSNPIYPENIYDNSKYNNYLHHKKNILTETNEINCKNAENYVESEICSQYEIPNYILEKIVKSYEKGINPIKVPFKSKKLSVIFDIDDTLINSTDRPIPSVMKLYNKCKSYSHILDVNEVPILTIFIITARTGLAYIMNQTEKTLYNVGVDKYDKIYYRRSYEDDPAKYKLACRKHIYNRGFNTILSVGDMYWDVGEYGGESLLIL